MTKKLNLTEKSGEDLTKMLSEKREELRTLRFGNISRTVKDTTDPKKARKQVARVLTEMHARTTAAMNGTEKSV